jgi:hypothetical protein
MRPAEVAGLNLEDWQPDKCHVVVVLGKGNMKGDKIINRKMSEQGIWKAFGKASAQDGRCPALTTRFAGAHTSGYARRRHRFENRANAGRSQ